MTGLPRGTGQPACRIWIIATGLALLAGGGAAADRLVVDEGAPLVIHLGAAALLYTHIAGGAIGLLAGAAAILTPKGRPLHRAAGRIFFYAMFASFLVAAVVAPFLEAGQRPNTIAGILSLYLLLTSWLAARSNGAATGRREAVSAIIALLVAGGGVWFMIEASQAASGTIGQTPPEAFIVFTAFGLAGAAGDLGMMLRRRMTGPARIVRHLWRMCAALFIAAGSFFLGQEQLLPDAIRGTVWQFAPVFFPLAAIAVWSVLARLPRRPRASVRPAAD
ncbi:DUF2306 domain-containing protein [Maricaulis sp.]|uniref:DUF2306 domain-containing protein n=1 Tax=Maricaulis sp. TaxID=1486257 RepID=UPI002615B2D6|nr:DUF2306 domain-containing protein [Maricaulis sp.]